MKTSRHVALIAAALLAAPSAFAEAYKVNVHIEPGIGTDLSRSGFISGAALKVDFDLLSIGPVAPQIEGFGLGTSDSSVLNQGSLFGGGIGLRWRILNDEKGYYFNPGTGSTGNLHGNLFLDAHFAISNGGPRVGFDATLGYELSLLDGLQIGPFVKFIYLKDALLLFGISFSVGGPVAPPAAANDDPDNDGIQGAADKCPNDPENKNGVEDEDGCPEKEKPVAKPDADHDRIPDADDKCPNDAETYNGVDDTDGCPESDATVFITDEKIVITEQIFFDTDKASIKPESDKLLDRVADLFMQFPDVKKVRIEGHTDDVGEDAYNLDLSQRRAEAVREALLKRGVAPERLEAKGFGETQPLVTATTDEARAKNRRVEFVIVDHGVAK